MATDNQDADDKGSLTSTGGVGALLRDTRQRQGCDLPTVAASLRIRQAYLQAIEDGRFENLPGVTYAVGFVRGYAEHLGLDSEEIIRRFKQENSAYANRAELVFPVAVSEGSIPTGALLVFAIIAAAAAYGVWYWYQSRDASLAEAVPPLPDRLAALIHRPVGTGAEVVPVAPADAAKMDDATLSAESVPPAATQPPVLEAPADSAAIPPSDPAAPAEAAGAGGVQVPAGSTAAAPVVTAAPTAIEPPPASPGTADRGGAAVVTPSAPAPATPASADGKPGQARTVKLADGQQAAVPTVGSPGIAPSGKAGDTAPGSRVVLRADEDCWIRIREAGGQTIYSRLLHKGETYSVPSRSGLSLTAGNAGALTVLVDGKATRSLGGIGIVRRDVSLDADRLVNGTAMPAPAAPAPAAPAKAGEGASPH